MQPEVDQVELVVDPDTDSPTTASDEIRPMSDHEKRLRREVARYREQARIAQNEREAACAAAVRERDEAITAAREEATGRVLRAELRSSAVRAGILDLDALRLADTGNVSVDENGDLIGVEEAIAALKQHKPYLFAAMGGEPEPITTTQLQKTPSPARPQVLDARSLSREAWRVERDRLLSAPR